MPKAKYNKLDFKPKTYDLDYLNPEDLYPKSKNFSELGTGEDGQVFDADAFPDSKDQMADVLKDIFCDEVVVQILFNLKDREKVVFMFQLLRESGYEIDYGSAAQTMGIQRQSYMKMLSTVKKKAGVILTDAYKAR